jgi:hypothetical protein
MTRDEALERLKTPPLDATTIAQEIAFVAAKLRITEDELMGYFRAPNKTYRDYRSQDSVYRFGAWAMRLLGMTRGGKR